jgi:hypothetical protein
MRQVVEQNRVVVDSSSLLWPFLTAVLAPWRRQVVGGARTPTGRPAMVVEEVLRAKNAASGAGMPVTFKC